MQSTSKSSVKYFLLFAILLLIGLGFFIFCSLFSLPASAPQPSGMSPTYVPEPSPIAADSLSGVDDVLNRALSGSIAYNTPESMKLEETVTIQLLLNPSISEAELGEQIEESGAVTTGTIHITPLMKAELKAQNEAFDIVPLHDTPEQPISETDTTRWQWQVTAKQEGTQRLTLVVYMLVKYEGRDYWREVETYKADIVVDVSLAQRFQTFDWEWLAGIFATSGLIPFVWRWVDKRRQSSKQAPPAKSTSG